MHHSLTFQTSFVYIGPGICSNRVLFITAIREGATWIYYVFGLGVFGLGVSLGDSLFGYIIPARVKNKRYS